MILGFFRTLFLFSILLFSLSVSAEDKTDSDNKNKKQAEIELPPADLENGKELYKKCALCHGEFAQGTLGGLYPRLAGMPIHYLTSQMEKYVDGSRSNGFSQPMLIIGGIKDMTAVQMNDLSSYIASIDLNKYYHFKIPEQAGADVKKGKKLFKGDCKSCHGKWANGRKKKKSPPLSGQYPEYLLRETEFFMAKSRYHDNDPEDDTFEDYSQQDLRNIFAYVAGIPFVPQKGYFKNPVKEKKTLKTPEAPKAPDAPSIVAKDSTGDTKSVKMVTVKQTVLKMALKDGMSIEDAVEAMKSKAIEKNMKNVGHQQVSKELIARGIKSSHLEIFQFCNPEDAMKMVRFNTIFAAYMPCRIALVEDAEGKMWLEMLNLDMLINSVKLPPELEKIAIETNGVMLDILTAGATGDF